MQVFRHSALFRGLLFAFVAATVGIGYQYLRDKVQRPGIAQDARASDIPRQLPRDINARPIRTYDPQVVQAQAIDDKQPMPRIMYISDLDDADSERIRWSGDRRMIHLTSAKVQIRVRRAPSPSKTILLLNNVKIEGWKEENTAANEEDTPMIELTAGRHEFQVKIAPGEPPKEEPIKEDAPEEDPTKDELPKEEVVAAVELWAPSPRVVAPRIDFVSHGKNFREFAAPTTPLIIYGSNPYLRLHGDGFTAGAEFRLVTTDAKNAFVDSIPIVAIEPASSLGRWVAEVRLPTMPAQGTMRAFVQTANGHQYSNPITFQVAAFRTGVATPRITEFNLNTSSSPTQADQYRPVSSEPIRINRDELRLRGDGDIPAGAALIAYSLDENRIVGANAFLTGNTGKWTVDAFGLRRGAQDLVVRLELGERILATSLPVRVIIQQRGPTVLRVEPANFGSVPHNVKLAILFAPEPRLNANEAVKKEHYEILASKGTGAFATGVNEVKPGVIDFDPVRNAVTMTFAQPQPIDLYRLRVKAPRVEPQAESGITDQFGNPLTGDGANPGTDYVTVLGPVANAIPQVATPPSPVPGVRPGTGPNVEFPEFMEPRPPTNGFNPSDKVETRVSRLYYYRDAHRVAQIINRDVQSYNRSAVEVHRQIADKARQEADAATDQRRLDEFRAVEAAKEARRIEQAIGETERDLAVVAQQQTDQRREVDRLRSTLANPNLPAPDRAKAQEELRRAELDLQRFSEGTVAAQRQVQAAAADLQAARNREVQANETVLQSQAVEDRKREEQFRREVAAAHEDPDTYAPGKLSSIDPVRQVSISVIGEGLIQLRGPIKGINVIRMMINQIDAPVGQVRVGVHTVQVNGERGERMEIVADKIQKYIDHSRFLTLQSGELLRKAIVKVAAARSAECVGIPGLTQEERDQKYLYAFFGDDFIRELQALDSEFLRTGNKILSLHSMDSTSLASALFVLALAKNSIRLEIIQEFRRMCVEELPVAEQRYLEAGFSISGKKRDRFRWHKDEFMLLANNAKFESILGLFDVAVVTDDTITPIQREFIRLAQIFKGRLMVEREYKQRVMERAMIEERLGDRLHELRIAKSKEETAQATLDDVEQEVAVQQEKVAAVLLELLQYRRVIEEQLAKADRAMKLLPMPEVQFDKQQDGTRKAATLLLGERVTLRSAIRTLPDKSEELIVEVTPNEDRFRVEWARLFNEALVSLEHVSTQLGALRLKPSNRDKLVEVSNSLSLIRQELMGPQREISPFKIDNQIQLEEVALNLKTIVRDVNVAFTELEKKVRLLFDLLSGGKDVSAAYREWLSIREFVEGSVEGPLRERITPLLSRGDVGFQQLVAMSVSLDNARRQAQAARRPLDHKKFLDMLIDEMEDKYIELLEGTRAHTANVDAYIKRLATALDDDFNTQFYHPAFRQVRSASRMWDVTLGQVEHTNILTNNRAFAKVSPQATMEFDLPKRDILLVEGLEGAKALMDDYGALLQDPTFLAAAKLRSGQPTSAPPKSLGTDLPTVRNVVPGLPSDSAERVLSQAESGNPEIGAALESLIPDPAIYKFETGTGYEIRPVIQPDGQSVTFHLNYMYTTNVREPVRADEKHLGRIKRHFIDTDVQLSNYELREVSRYTVALKASRTSRGVPLLEDVPLAGVLFRPLPSDESSLQQNIILSQATIFPTLFDLMGLRWAPAVADLDPLRLSNEEFLVRGRNRFLMNRVFDHSSAKVDEFLRIPEAERRPDLYRSQETIPSRHPNGYQGPGLNLRDSQLHEGYTPTLRSPSTFVPSENPEGAQGGPMLLLNPEPLESRAIVVPSPSGQADGAPEPVSTPPPDQPTKTSQELPAPPGPAPQQQGAGQHSSVQTPRHLQNVNDSRPKRLSWPGSGDSRSVSQHDRPRGNSTVSPPPGRVERATYNAPLHQTQAPPYRDR